MESSQTAHLLCRFGSSYSMCILCFSPSIFHYMLLKYSIFHMPQVGASAAYLETGLVLVKRYVTLMLSSVLIITWLNLR